MKKSALIFILLVSIPGIVFSTPIITIANRYINLGNLPQETKKAFSITVKNNGTTELWIRNIHTPCGCTDVTINNDRILSAGEAEILIVFDTGKYIDKVQKYIEIISNDEKMPYYKVYFEANVYPEFVAHPEIIDFNRILRRSGKKMAVSIRHKDNKEFQVEGIYYNKDLLEVSSTPVKQEDAFQLDVVLTARPHITVNQLEEEILFLFKLEEIKRFTISALSAIEDNDLFFDPGMVRFQENNKQVKVMLKNYSTMPFGLKEIKNSSRHFQVTYTKISGNEYQLNFLLMDAKKNFFDTITVITDIPEEKETILRVMY